MMEARTLSRRRPRRVRAEIQADLQKARSELSTSLEELQRSLQHSVAPQEWVRKHFGPCLIGAFALGLMLGRR